VLSILIQKGFICATTLQCSGKAVRGIEATFYIVLRSSEITFLGRSHIFLYQ